MTRRAAMTDRIDDPVGQERDRQRRHAPDPRPAKHPLEAGMVGAPRPLAHRNVTIGLGDTTHRQRMATTTISPITELAHCRIDYQRTGSVPLSGIRESSAGNPERPTADQGATGAAAAWAGVRGMGLSEV